MKKILVFISLTIFLIGCTTAALQTMEMESNLASRKDDSGMGESVITQPIEAVSEGMPLLVWDKGEVLLRIAYPLNGEVVEGKETLSLGESGSMPYAFAISPGRDKIAVVTGTGMVCSAYGGGSRCMTGSDRLHIVDLNGWEVHSFPIPGEASGLEKGWVVGKPVFSQDGLRVTIAYATPETNTVLQYTSDTGARFASRSLDFTPELLVYTDAGDGGGILVYGTPEGEEPGVSQPTPPRVEILDSNTLEPLGIIYEGVLSGSWCLENCESDHAARRIAYWRPGAALSPDGNTFYLVHPGEAVMTVFDLVKMDVIEVPIKAISSRTGVWAWLDQLARMTARTAHAKGMTEGELVYSMVSTDGKMLYIVRQPLDPDVVELNINLSIQLVDVGSGEVLKQLDNLDNMLYIRRLWQTADGENVLLSGWDENGALSQVYNGDDLQFLGEIDGWDVVPVETLGGANLLLGLRQSDNQTELRLIDQESLAMHKPWSVDGFATWVSEQSE